MSSDSSLELAIESISLRRDEVPKLDGTIGRLFFGSSTRSHCIHKLTNWLQLKAAFGTMERLIWTGTVIVPNNNKTITSAATDNNTENCVRNAIIQQICQNLRLLDFAGERAERLTSPCRKVAFLLKIVSKIFLRHCNDR